MKKYLFVIPIMALLSSCIGLTNISTPQTVALSEGNFKFVKSVSAEIKALYIFGIGGFKDEANEDVVEKLRLRADLQQNQALADIRVKTTTKTYLGIVTKRTLTAAASVVEFKDPETNTFDKTNSVSELTIKRDNKEDLSQVVPTEQEQKVEEKYQISNEVITSEKKDKKEVLSQVTSTEQEQKVEDNIQVLNVINTNEYTRDSAYNKLLEIKESIVNGTEISRNDTKEEYKKIKKWYYRVQPTYLEIETLLKEIKKLL